MDSLKVTPEVCFADGLLAYCTKYQQSIYIRAKRGERWVNVSLADASGAELLERINDWAARQFVPVRVLAEDEAGKV